MYEAFYGLKEKPFSIQPDPDFLFMSRRHSLAYAMLEHGILNRAGFCVISGEIGCGKTTLVRHLLNNLGDDVHVGLVYNTHREIADILKWIMLAFGQPYEGPSKVALYENFQNFLIEKYTRGKRVVLIIDEAQNLTPKQMKTLITRAGPGTKVVCLGNIAQIDTPYLTEGSSGLTYVVDRFKGWEHSGHVTLMRGERSRLADYAGDVL